MAAKYCDEYVCVCVYMCLSVREDISRTTRVIFTKLFLHGRGSVLLQQGDEIPGRRGDFGGFLPHWQCTSIAFGSHTKTAEPTEMPFGWSVGLAWGTVCYVGVTIPEWEGAVLGKHLPDKPNTPNNCELDWSMQRHTTGADAWLQALNESIFVREGGGIAHRRWSLISTIALFYLHAVCTLLDVHRNCVYFCNIHFPMNCLDQAPGTTAYTAVLLRITDAWEIPAVDDTGKSHQGDHEYQLRHSSESCSRWEESSKCWSASETD